MNISKVFEEYIEKEESYRIAYDIVRRNSKGKIWLIGGALSRNLNQLIYGTPQHSFDFDFIVEECVEKFDLPEDWKIGKNSYGGWKITNSEISIDHIPLNLIDQNIRRKLRPTVENFLTGTPFTIQSMAYDTGSKEIFGEIGIAALKSRKFEVNDLEQARITAKKRGMSVNELISKKAKSMGFKAVLID